MKDRILAIRKTLRLNQSEFAGRLGIKRAAPSMIEVGTNNLTDQNIKLICMTFGINEQWLRTGAGDMFSDASPYETEFFEIYRDLMPETQHAILQLAKQLLETQKKLSGG
jgi:transcriptional regulator with XRE-family HTH domain